MNTILFKCFILPLCVSILILLSNTQAYSQEYPPRPISVNTVQNLNFGSFSQGFAGGTVIISTVGSRSKTGDIILIGIGYTQAIIELDANPGTVINITNGADATLNGSNGGSMTLHIGGSNPASPFVTTAVPPAKTQVSIGATLTVSAPASNPPGNFSGSFSVIFNQE